MIQEYDPTPLNPPLFIFQLSQEAATYNADILARKNFDLKQVILAQHPSQISFGSEFNPTSVLQQLLSHHPLWDKLKDILDNGASFPLEDISDADRRADLEFHSNRGNHKSAQVHQEVLAELISEDVSRSFALPLPISVLHLLPGASLAPLGCVKQSSLDAQGNRTTKYRMTHDQSFLGLSKSSVNSRSV